MTCTWVRVHWLIVIHAIIPNTLQGAFLPCQQFFLYALLVKTVDTEFLVPFLRQYDHRGVVGDKAVLYRNIDDCLLDIGIFTEVVKPVLQILDFRKSP